MVIVLYNVNICKKQIFLDNRCFKCGKYGHKALACRYVKIKPTKKASPPVRTKKVWRRKDEMQITKSSKDIKEESFVLQKNNLLRGSRSLSCAQ